MNRPTCAAAGCDNPLPRRTGRFGRPPIYCSPTCRPSRNRPPIHIEVDQDPDEANPGRDWTVRLRRGTRQVTVGSGLGRFTATLLATELRHLLHTTNQEGADLP